MVLTCMLAHKTGHCYHTHATFTASNINHRSFLQQGKFNSGQLNYRNPNCHNPKMLQRGNKLNWDICCTNWS